MSFMKELQNNALPIWDESVNTPFVQELKKGTLPTSKLKRYMVQDSLYLTHFARVCGKAIYHCTELREIQVFYSMLDYVSNTESELRLDYLKQLGIMTDELSDNVALPANQKYMDFQMAMAEEGDMCKTLMTILPCMFSYNHIFRTIANEPGIENTKYWDVIKDYTDEEYAQRCKAWSDFADEKCHSLPDSEKEQLADIFKKASLMGLAYWEMAYGE
jgi:thiaminase/transcriptional activator TenA